MKQIYLVFVLFSAFFPKVFAQTLTFTRNYGGPGYDDARSMAAAEDGCLVFTGLSDSGPDELGDLYLTKVNAAGAVLWTKYYGRPKEDGGNFVMRSSDGGYLISGHTAFSPGDECDGYLVKTDADGEELWRSVIGTDYDDVCNGALELEDGTFIATGRVENEATHSFRVLLAKISASGEQIFLKELATNLPSHGIRLVRSTDGNLIIAGYSYHPDQFGTEMLVLKCDLEGHVLWQTNTGIGFNHRAYALVPMPDGGCVAVGGSSDAMDQPVQMEAFHLDANGEIIASNTALAGTGKGYLYDIVRTSDDRLAIAGVLQESATGLGQPVFGILNEDLSVNEWRTANFSAECRTRGLLEDAAGNFVLCGNVAGQQGAPDDIFLAKLPPASGTSGVKDIQATAYLLFPNPFHEFTYLKVGTPSQTKTLTISTPDGKELCRTVFEGEELFVYRHGLKPGNYVFVVRDGAGKLMVSGQMIIE